MPFQFNCPVSAMMATFGIVGLAKKSRPQSFGDARVRNFALALDSPCFASHSSRNFASGPLLCFHPSQLSDRKTTSCLVGRGGAYFSTALGSPLNSVLQGPHQPAL